jgi:serpin B
MDRTNRLDRRKFLAAGLGYTGLASLGCEGVTGSIMMTPPPVPRPKPTLSPEQQELVKGQQRFAVELYGKLREKAGNLFWSPFSVSTALAMTAAGAAGDTAAEMFQVLHLPGPRVMPAAFEGVVESLTDARYGRPYQLHVANALWGHKGYPWRREFLETTQKQFRAGLREVDFLQPEPTRQTINRWVAEQTAQRIPELFDQGTITTDMRLVLTNAVYFKGLWADQFDKKQTRDLEFRPAPGQKLQVPMMHRHGSYAFYQDPALKLVELPYQGNDLSMVALLPKRDDGLAELEKSLSAERLTEWLGKARRVSLPVWLPRFKMTASFGLIPTLEALGMKAAFDPDRADFSGMTSAQRLFINRVEHKAFVEVTEEGTEAAAATGVGMALTAAPLDPPAFKADHPFLVLIRDKYTGCVLFLGRVANPADK